jgi:hypothetical protein
MHDPVTKIESDDDPIDLADATEAGAPSHDTGGAVFSAGATS